MAESWEDIVSPMVNSVKRSNNKRKRSESSTATDDRIDDKKIIKETMSDMSDEGGSIPSTSADAQVHFSPSQIAGIVEELRVNIRGNKRNASKRFIGFNDFGDISLPPGTTTEMLKNDLRRYLKEASLLTSMTVPMALEVLHVFLEEGHSLTLDPDFPKKPPNAFSIFVKKFSQGKFSPDTAALWKCESHAAEKAEAEKKALNLMKKYLEALRAYRDTHPDLTNSHRDFLENAISIAQKSIGKTEKSTTNNKKVIDNKKKIAKKEPKTAFDLFALTLTSKYADLEPDKREKKLRKKFNKLSDSERGIYESLAEAL